MEKRQRKMLVNSNTNGQYGRSNKLNSKATIQVKIETNESTKMLKEWSKETKKGRSVVHLASKEKSEVESVKNKKTLGFKAFQFFKENLSQGVSKDTKKSEEKSEELEMANEIQSIQDKKPMYEKIAEKVVERVTEKEARLKEKKEKKAKKEESNTELTMEKEVNKGVKNELVFGMTARDLYIENRRLRRNESKMSNSLMKDVKTKKEIIQEIQKEITELYESDVDAYEEYLMKRNTHPRDSYFQENWNDLSVLWEVKIFLNKLQPNTRDLEKEIVIMQEKMVRVELELGKEIAESNKSIEQLKVEKEKSEDKNGILEGRIQELEGKNRELVEQWERNKGRFQEMQTAYKDIQIKGKEERIQKETVIKEKEKLEADMITLESEIEQLRNQIVEFEEKLELVEVEKQKLMEEVTLKDKENRMSSKKVELLETQLNQIKNNEANNQMQEENHRELLLQENQQLKEEMVSINDKVRKLEEQLEENLSGLLKLETKQNTIENCDSITKLLKLDFIHPTVKKQWLLLLKERKNYSQKPTEQISQKETYSYSQQHSSKQEEGNSTDKVLKSQTEIDNSKKKTTIISASEDIKQLINHMKENQAEINVFEEMKEEQQTEEKKTIALFKKHGYEVRQEKPNEYYVIEPQTMKRAIFVHFDKPIKDEEEFDKISQKCNLFVLSFTKKEDKKVSNRSLGKWLNRQNTNKQKQVQFSLNSEPELMQKPPEKLGGLV